MSNETTVSAGTIVGALRVTEEIRVTQAHNGTETGEDGVRLPSVGSDTDG